MAAAAMEISGNASGTKSMSIDYIMVAQDRGVSYADSQELQMVKTTKKTETKKTKTLKLPPWSAEYKAAILSGKIKEK